MVIRGVVHDFQGTPLKDVQVSLREAVRGPGRAPLWSGTFDLEPQAAAYLMHDGAPLMLRLSDGREGWCYVNEVDFSPGARAGFLGCGPLQPPSP